MQRTVSLFYAVVGLINLAPIVGVLGAHRLEALYGTPIPGGDLVVLLRHRAILLAIVGGLACYAAVAQHVRPVAAGAAFVSMLSFIVLTAVAESPEAPLARVAWVDVGASVLLAIAVVLDRARPPWREAERDASRLRQSRA